MVASRSALGSEPTEAALFPPVVRQVFAQAQQPGRRKGFTHAFNVAAQDMAKNPGGLTYALLANVEPNVRVVPLAAKEGEPYLMPTLENVYSHKYPLSRFVYIYVNRPPGKPLEPKLKEFLKAY